MADLLNVIVRHQVYLEGLKSGKNAEFVKMMAQLDGALRKELAFVDYKNLNDMSRTAINKLIVTLKKVASKIADVWLNELIRWLGEYVAVDTDFWKFTYGLAQPDAEFSEDDAEGNTNAWLGLPMAANGITALLFLKGWNALVGQRISQTVLMSYSNAETPQQLIARLNGTRAANYRDGLLGLLNRQGQAVNNTVIQHLAAQANINVMSQAWPQYLWVSVLDDATTKICRNRNGHVYRFGEGPLPPAHVGCRSSIMPYDGRPVEMPSFPMWAGSQSEAFIKDAFDGEVPSRYEGSKALSLEQFKTKRALIVG
jgi:SPP1 gp7 family putative phage head morphogenesis protein